MLHLLMNRRHTPIDCPPALAPGGGSRKFFPTTPARASAVGGHHWAAEHLPVLPQERYENWVVDDPAGQDAEHV